MAKTGRIYLDYNATAPLRPAARDAMGKAMDLFGNPSSVHAEGRAARELIEGARRVIADLAGCASAEVVFTSGATEAAAIALTPEVFGARGEEALLGVFVAEHPCVLQGHRFPHDRVTILPSDSLGRIDLEALGAWVVAGAGRPLLLALQAANNETGVIQPVAEAAGILRHAGGLVFCDAVQAAGRMAIDVLDADFIALSAHKLGGPKGVGALVSRGQRFPAAAALMRGAQERGLRAGTENVVGIAGFGAAAREALLALGQEPARLEILRDRFEAGMLAIHPATEIFGQGAPRLGNTSCLTLPDCPAETMLMALDLAGVAVSSGAACSSGKVKASHVLAGMGVPGDLAAGALRISLGWASYEADIDIGLARMRQVAETLQARRRKTAA